MAKGIYFGVGDVARKSKKVYFGVSDVARKVKKVYFGVSDVARLTYSAGISKIANATALTSYHNGGFGASNASYAIIGGGLTDAFGGTSSQDADAYNSSLVKTNIATLGGVSQGVTGFTLGGLACTRVGNGIYGVNTSLVVTQPVPSINAVSGSTIGSKNWEATVKHSSYVYLAGGNSSGTPTDSSSQTSQAYRFNESFVFGSLTFLNKAVTYAGGSSCGDYALFIGGESSGSPAYLAVAYSTAGVQTIISSQFNYANTGSNNSNYAIFCGGGYTHSETSAYAYNASLVRTTITLPTSGGYRSSTSFDDKVLFSSGRNTDNTISPILSSITNSLVIEPLPDLSLNVCMPIMAKISNKLLIGGGYGTTYTPSTLVNVYEA